MVSSSRLVAVVDGLEQQGQLLGVWHGMLDKLRAGNITGALDYIDVSKNAKYQSIFNDLQPDLAEIMDSVGTAYPVARSENLGELVVTRNRNGIPEAYLLYLMRSHTGVWVLVGM
jgi:hypothetical protein